MYRNKAAELKAIAAAVAAYVCEEVTITSNWQVFNMSYGSRPSKMVRASLQPVGLTN